MAKKKPAQKNLSQLDQERQARFNEAIEKIKNGTTRKQAILSSGMDPRTFNKLIATSEDSGKLFITKTDNKGHYRLSGTSTVYARWEVYRKDDNIEFEFLDLAQSQIMSRYWNTFQSALAGHSDMSTFTPKYIYNSYGDKIELELDYTTLERWHSRIISKRSTQEEFNENVYERTSIVA